MATNQGDRFLEGGEHAEAQQVDLDDSEIGAVVFIPLYDVSIDHGRGLYGYDLVEATRCDHDSPTVLTEMSREPLDRTDQIGPMLYVL